MVVEYFEYVARALIQNVKEFLHFYLMIFGSCVFEMDQVIFDVGKS